MAKCARCGRKITSQESIYRGFGGECFRKRIGSKPVKSWKRAVINSANLQNGVGIQVGQRFYSVEEIDDGKVSKKWLIKNRFIIGDDDVSNEILDEIFKNPEKFFNGGNDAEETESGRE